MGSLSDLMPDALGQNDLGVLSRGRHSYVPILRVINPSTRTPRRTVWLSIVVAFILGLPLLQVELL